MAGRFSAELISISIKICKLVRLPLSEWCRSSSAMKRLGKSRLDSFVNWSSMWAREIALLEKWKATWGILLIVSSKKISCLFDCFSLHRWLDFGLMFLIETSNTNIKWKKILNKHFSVNLDEILKLFFINLDKLG